jgi:hypothetical protein
MVKPVPFLQQSSGDKKVLKKHNNQPPKQRLTGVGLARDEATKVE